jgi:hypothetical protein
VVVVIIICLLGVVAIAIFAFARSATDSTTRKTPDDLPGGDHRKHPNPPDA